MKNVYKTIAIQYKGSLCRRYSCIWFYKMHSKWISEKYLLLGSQILHPPSICYIGSMPQNEKSCSLHPTNPKGRQLHNCYKLKKYWKINIKIEFRYIINWLMNSQSMDIVIWQKKLNYCFCNLIVFFFKNV